MFDAEMKAGVAGSRVLVAEDDPFIAEELRHLLIGKGAEVIGPFPTVRAALAVIAVETPDAAVLDVNLRDRSSAPITEALRCAAVPTVLVTGYPRALLDDPALRDAPILPKPLHDTELLSLLERMIRRERPAQPA